MGTKAETLSRLRKVVTKSEIGKQVALTINDWNSNPTQIVSKIKNTFQGMNLIVRSSDQGEDNWEHSNAGGFDSILNIDGNSSDEIINAINEVIASYGSFGQQGTNQVLVQKFIQNVKFSGVIFTCGLETGSPYYRINFDDKSDSTTSVTAGIQNDLRTVIVSRGNTDELDNLEPKLTPVMLAIKELESILTYNKLDIEFAVDADDKVHIFQVRAIVVDHSEYEIGEQTIYKNIKENINRFRELQEASPFIYGSKTFFGNMPDWNPAEIIGVNPKPLAFSLYRYLITDEIWAAQRSEYGYRDVRPHPLLVSFSGHPYIDMRASLNSFIPKDLQENLAEKLVNVYLNILEDKPYLHDKIEFSVAFTIWTPCFSEEARGRLMPYGITEAEINMLEMSLKKITTLALTRLKLDILSIDELSKRRERIKLTNQNELDKLYYLLDDCKRYGTKAFAHAARSGFVSSILLRSFVREGWLDKSRKMEFLRSIKTVTGMFEDDKLSVVAGQLNPKELVKRYGHLRPGTYEIETHAYWEDCEKYLSLVTLKDLADKDEFCFSDEELNKFNVFLSKLSADITAHELVEFIAEAVQAREYVKFEFTKNLSMALDYGIEYGKTVGLSRNDLSFLEYSDLHQLKLGLISYKEIGEKISERKRTYRTNQLVDLPSLILKERDMHCFERHFSQPNFVTLNKIESEIVHLKDHDKLEIKGKIVLISQADPGYDWLFSKGIVGLITKFGGANSHMAIRAAELNLPAAIGVGEQLYDQLSVMRSIELDCANWIIREII